MNEIRINQPSINRSGLRLNTHRPHFAGSPSGSGDSAGSPHKPTKNLLSQLWTAVSWLWDKPMPLDLTNRDQIRNRWQSIIDQDKRLAYQVNNITHEPTLPTFGDERLIDKLTQYTMDSAYYLSTITLPKTLWAKSPFNELNQILKTFAGNNTSEQSYSTQKLLDRFMTEGYQAYYPPQPSTTHSFHILRYQASGALPEYKGANIPTPEYYLSQLTALTEQTPSLINKWVRTFAFDDPLIILAPAGQDAAYTAAYHEAFPDIEWDEMMSSQPISENNTVPELITCAKDIASKDPHRQKNGWIRLADLVAEIREIYLNTALSEKHQTASNAGTDDYGS